MKLIKKPASGRLARAIVALTRRSDNKLQSDQAKGGPSEEFDGESDDRSRQTILQRRTTITVKTERLLVVRSGRQSFSAEANADDDSPRLAMTLADGSRES